MQAPSMSISEYNAREELRRSIRRDPGSDENFASPALVEITGIEILKAIERCKQGGEGEQDDSLDSFAEDSVKLVQEFGNVQGEYNIRISRRMSNCSSLGMEGDDKYLISPGILSMNQSQRRESIGSTKGKQESAHVLTVRRSSLGAMRRASIGSYVGSIPEQSNDCADYDYGVCHVPRRSSLGGYSGKLGSQADGPEYDYGVCHVPRRSSLGGYNRRRGSVGSMNSIKEAFARAPRRSSLCSDYETSQSEADDNDVDSTTLMFRINRRRLSDLSHRDSMRNVFKKSGHRRLSNGSDYAKMKRRLSSSSQVSLISVSSQHSAVSRAA